MERGQATPGQDSFVLLDGLRGMGAILVLVGHTMQYWGGFWAPSGAVVVDMFFLLSGFVIAYAYEPKLAQGLGVGAFMLSRIVRLYPLYLLGMVLGFIVLFAMAVGDADGGERGLALVAQLAPQLVMLPAPPQLGSPDLYSLNVPAWTLLFELVVNFVYVAAFRWLRDTRVLALLVVAFAVALAAAVLVVGRIDAGSDWATFWAGLARAGFGFFAGVLTFRLMGAPRTTKRPVSNWSFVLLLAIPVAGFIPATPELRPFVDMTLAMALGMPVLWLCQAMAPPLRYHALFTVGGRISYAIYILHQPFRELAERISWRSGVLFEIRPIGGIVILVAVVGLAYVAERFYDRPVRRWIVSRLKRRAAVRAGGVAISAG